MKPKYKILLLVLMLGLTAASFASAAIVECGGPGKTECRLSDLFVTIERVINFLLSWAWLVATFYVMWAGYNMMTSGGNSEALDSAKTQFRNAIIGFFMIMTAYLLLNWIISIFTGTGEPKPGSYNILRNLLP